MGQIVSFIIYIFLDCYSICVLTTTIFIYAIIVIFLFGPNFFIIKLFETLIFFSFLISYLITVLINPGIPNRNYYSNNFYQKNNDIAASNLIKCDKCNIIAPKSLKINHCESCHVCVMYYDHHCPWTGKCIGKYNICPFYFFLFSLLAYIFMSFITFLMFIINLEESEIQNRRKIKNIKHII